MPKHIKLYGLILMILLCINVTVFKIIDEHSDEKYNELKSFYQQKNDSAFLYLKNHASSAIPLAETLETISLTKENEVPAKVQQLIERAKTQTDEMDEQLLAFIEFSEDYSDNTDPKLLINNTVMNSDKQGEMFTLAYEGSIWNLIYSISYDYWKTKPKLINDRTRETLLLVATELRKLDKTIMYFKESGPSFTVRNFEKAALLNSLKPHLEKLDTIQDEFFGRE